MKRLISTNKKSQIAQLYESQGISPLSKALQMKKKKLGQTLQMRAKGLLNKKRSE